MFGFWFFIAVIVVAKSPIGKAIADRIAGRLPEAGGMSHAELDALEHRLDERLLDLEDRLEFAERRLSAGSADLPPINSAPSG